MTAASTAGVKKPARKALRLSDAPLELGLRGATCCDPSGGDRVHLYGTGRWVVNSKGQLHLQHTRQPRLIDVLRDARWSAPRELQQWLPPRRGVELVESLWPG